MAAYSASCAEKQAAQGEQICSGNLAPAQTAEVKTRPHARFFCISNKKMEQMMQYNDSNNALKELQEQHEKLFGK